MAGLALGLAEHGAVVVWCGTWDTAPRLAHGRRLPFFHSWPKTIQGVPILESRTGAPSCSSIPLFKGWRGVGHGPRLARSAVRQ
jgi:hypothetical protein